MRDFFVKSTERFLYIGKQFTELLQILVRKNIALQLLDSAIEQILKQTGAIFET